MIEIMELNTEDCDYVLKGHNLSEIDMLEAIEKHFDDKIIILSKYETWCHWCYGTWDGEKQRYCLFDKKYNGVCGGFPITVIDETEFLKES